MSFKVEGCEIARSERRNQNVVPLFGLGGSGKVRQLNRRQSMDPAIVDVKGRPWTVGRRGIRKTVWMLTVTRGQAVPEVVETTERLAALAEKSGSLKQPVNLMVSRAHVAFMSGDYRTRPSSLSG
jgi:hypothetical protein